MTQPTHICHLNLPDALQIGAPIRKQLSTLNAEIDALLAQRAEFDRNVEQFRTDDPLAAIEAGLHHIGAAEVLRVEEIETLAAEIRTRRKIGEFIDVVLLPALHSEHDSALTAEHKAEEAASKHLRAGGWDSPVPALVLSNQHVADARNHRKLVRSTMEHAESYARASAEAINRVTATIDTRRAAAIPA